MEKLFDAEQIKLTNQIIALMGLVCLANLVDWLIITIRFQSIFECYKRIRIDVIMISPSA